MNNFSARETEWMEELDGIELASFWRRAFAFLIDWLIVAIALSAIVTAVTAGFLAFMHRQGRSAVGGDDNLASCRKTWTNTLVDCVLAANERATATSCLPRS